MQTSDAPIRIAIACGGTGGHLFPGLAIAESLFERGCSLTLLVSSKEVDQNAVRNVTDMEIVTLPAVGLDRGGMLAFLRGFWRSYRMARKRFLPQPPHAVLAMGGFTSAPPLLAAAGLGCATFLHEANSIPGRANRWLAPWVQEAFVYFPAAARRLRAASVQVTGMPVRPQFEKQEAAACRMMLGLKGEDPVLLTMGGSQGASGINQLVVQALPALLSGLPKLQFVHLTGAQDEARVRAAYAARPCRAVVRAFLTEIELAMSAASLAVSRAGASSLAEVAALGLPAVLIPYPTAADNHQYHNALAFVETGAARMITQKVATPEVLAQLLLEMLRQPAARTTIENALGTWRRPEAAAEIATRIWDAAARHQADGAEPSTALPPGRPLDSFSSAASAVKPNFKPLEL